ncbi:MAG: 50S ribosomal protein L25/general stress protein Ctc [Actinobacteria bacterium]|nr:50S ribosomal protein L25/general stress protein Ctc [Actinomycetota bacterium]MBU4240813.1 50S ribosomal protein L25/general stress protein Ctc [Actinomycetota bacterium]MBU4302738.1 50S ribosomal protein L25/general stress protein Ctc [Actinomycetota bacterium]MBU4489034.1 50S ribosomal protein L25/general stress protein Ctc [Actinomycetota bacterium]MCG2796097.1 50S ribosomal protein L25/general stress protein Ctc [Actinomycetes bacterium]
MELKLEARKRELTGKGGARKIRAQGEVPAVVYGLGTESRNLAVKKGDIWEAIQGEAGLNVLIDLQVVDGKEKDSHLVMIKEVQRHPFKEMILHVDFLMVARDETVTMKVPIKIVGEQESVGLKNGGTLQHSLWDVEVECLPADIPEGLSLDVSSLDIGDSLRVSDLDPPGEVSILVGPEDVVVNILAPRIVTEEEEEEELLEEVKEGMEPAEEAPEDGAPSPGGEEG